MDQLSLLPEYEVETPERKSDRKWAQCKKERPDLVQALARLALKLHARGVKHASVDDLFHRLRWETMLTTGVSGFKIDNDLTAPASRELMKLHPELAGFFETRARRQGD